MDGGGRPGEGAAGAGGAGVAEAVGGTEARTDAGAWGVAAADMVVVQKKAMSNDTTSVVLSSEVQHNARSLDG